MVIDKPTKSASNYAFVSALRRHRKGLLVCIDRSRLCVCNRAARSDNVPGELTPNITDIALNQATDPAYF